MKITKIDVAEAHIISAVTLLFNDGHPISVYHLACAAREILTTIGEKMQIETALHEYAAAKAISLKDAIARNSEFANFMKHADRDPMDVLQDFDEDDALKVLFIACNDFGRITGGMPVEAQVYECW
jgi:hypothetical protein